MSCKLINSYIKIRSLGLMIKHEQFYLNYSTKHFNSQKLFFENTVSRIVKPSVTIFEKSQFIGSPYEPTFHGHFRPHSNQYMIYYAKTQFETPNQSWLLLLGFKNSYQFGPKFWDRSNGPSRPHSTRTFVKYLKRE